VRGAFETHGGNGPVSTEEWALADSDGAFALHASGSFVGGRPRSWVLDARVTAAGRIDALEWQLTPRPPPTEVTTVAIRSHGDRAFITRIPPGGVPERVETTFAGGSLVVGPSLALLALLLRIHPPAPGMGRRAVFVRLGEDELSVRLEDGIVLSAGRTRGVGADGRPGWVRKTELRTALSAGRPEAVLTADASGALTSAQWPQALPARATTATRFEP
jgi:hypothetical protein